MNRSSAGKKLFDSTNIPDDHPVLGDAGAPEKPVTGAVPEETQSGRGGGACWADIPRGKSPQYPSHVFISGQDLGPENLQIP